MAGQRAPMKREAHAPALFEQRLGEVGADEASTPGDQGKTGREEHGQAQSRFRPKLRAPFVPAPSAWRS